MGGSQKYCYELSERLSQMGHEVTIYTSSINGFESCRISPSFRIVACRTIGIVPPHNPLSLMASQFLRDESHLLHVHSYVFLASLQACIASKLVRKPFVLHLHGGLADTILGNNMRSRVLSWMKVYGYDPTVGAFLLHSADAVVSVSRKDLEAARTRLNVDDSKLFFVPNAVDVEHFTPRPSKQRSSLNVAYIGRLEPWKGISLFIDLACRLHSLREDVRFLVAGNGSQHAVVANFARSNSFLSYLGVLTEDGVNALLQDTDILVIPSFLEGIPTILLEAMATAVPVVSSSAGGISEVITHGQNGYLFEPGDVASCLSLIETLIQDKELRKRLGANGRKTVVQNNSWSHVLPRVTRIYQKLME